MAYQSLENRIGKILIKSAGLKESDLERVLALQKENGKRIGDILVELNLIGPNDIGKALALQLGLPFMEDLNPKDIEPTLVKDISISYCRENRILPISEHEDFIRIAVVDPFHYEPLDAFRAVHQKEVDVVLTTPQKLDEAINRVYERAENIIKGLEEEAEEYDDFNLANSTVDLLEAGDDTAPVIRFIRTLLSRAVKENASDIHIEPFENKVTVRFRVDGVMYDVYDAPKQLSSAISTGIKVMGDLNIAEKRVPQDGRFKIKVGSKEIDIRLSVVPVNFGERIVMRLLDKTAVVLELLDLGFSEDYIKEIDSLIGKKYGIFLVTGPTGSGKSTTLAACLKRINSPERNIITVEDPVEYNLNGIGQIAVNHKVGLDFAKGLRAILRQDPDVVMVGEIRDKETAEISIQASLTGHLVLSTLHTNDAPSAVTRLIDMGVEPFLISSSFVGVLAQRLLRILCDTCAETYTATEKQLVNANIHLDELEKEFGITKMPKLKKPKGCAECRQTGYKGRTSITELLKITDEIKSKILENEDANSIRRIAVKGGMTSLRSSAIKKMLDGVTSLDEILRVTNVDG